MSARYQAPILYFLARKHRLAYLQVPKVACSSFRAAMALLSRPDLSRDAVLARGAIHQYREWNDIAGPENKELASFFRFTFVRHPIARFVSFYGSKICRADGEPTRPRFQKLGYSREMTMEDVLAKIEGTAPEELDDHIVPQSAIVFRHGSSRVDFLGRLEQLAADVKRIEERTGVHLDLPHLNPTSNVREVDANAQISPELRGRLERLYAEDFDLLGYPR
jgi:Sulfotransferase family